MVLSTLHTNSAIGAITRLDDMGVEPFLIASSLTGVLAQRLVRILCKQCKAPAQVTVAEAAILGIDASQAIEIHHPKGCAACRFTGYIGRTGLYELIAIDDNLRQMIHDRQPEQQLRHYARQSFLSLRQDGFRRVLLGDTSLEEVLRVSIHD